LYESRKKAEQFAEAAADWCNQSAFTDGGAGSTRLSSWALLGKEHGTTFRQVGAPD
jgi:hypothetical protein